MTPGQHHAAILALLDTYFEGLYHADSALLAGVFHPRSQYVNTMPDEFTLLSLPEYREVLDQRVSPAERGESRCERIVSLDVDSDTLAFAKVEMTMLGRDYTDYLTLVCDQGKWQIMAKIFSYTIRTQGD